jgi:shikimate kinase
MAALLDEEGVVIATGGGWAAQPQWVDGLPPGTGTVWLQVTAVEAVGRVQAEPGKRPLLDSDEPVDTARKLVESRSPSYALAEWKVDTEGRSVEDVSARILEMFSGNDLILDAE